MISGTYAPYYIGVVNRELYCAVYSVEYKMNFPRSHKSFAKERAAFHSPSRTKRMFVNNVGCVRVGCYKQGRSVYRKGRSSRDHVGRNEVL